MTYYSRLKAELDDWIDPSLPRMYTLLRRKSFVLSDEFTDANDDFRNTLLFPAWTPVITACGMCLKPI